MPELVNLFPSRSSNEAKQLYSLYLSSLLANSRERQALDACVNIRQFASKQGKPKLSDFTYPFAIEALCKLHDFTGAWQQLRQTERLAFGQNINFKKRVFTPAQLDWFAQYHPQILYFLGRYQLAARLLEASLAAKLRTRRKGLSYELLGYIYNSISQPTDRHEVTLFHVYQKLGKTLSEWKQWKRFLNGFDPKLFRIAGIAQTNFLRDASLLHQFVEKIEAAKHQRLTARVTSGERDIIAPGGVVHSYQNSVARSRELQTGDYNKIKDNLREIFPDLRDLHY